MAQKRGLGRQRSISNQEDEQVDNSNKEITNYKKEPRLVPDQHNKANTTINSVKPIFWFPNAIKGTLITLI